MRHTKALINELQSLNIPVEKRNEYLCSALAVGLATRCPLPSGKLKNVQGYFHEHHRRSAVTFINAVNEDIVFDAKEAIELVGRVYALRYAFAYEPQAFGVSAHLMTLMGVDRYATPVKYKEVLSDAEVAKTANQIQKSVMSVFQNYLEEQAATHDATVDA
jgi:hypothetical protein